MAAGASLLRFSTSDRSDGPSKNTWSTPPIASKPEGHMVEMADTHDGFAPSRRRGFRGRISAVPVPPRWPRRRGK
jgi:hypothetical protein